MTDITDGGAGTIKIQEYKIATRCFICGEEVVIPDPYSYPVVCDDCKRAIQIVKSLYKDKPCWGCRDFKCGCCTKVTSS